MNTSFAKFILTVCLIPLLFSCVQVYYTEPQIFGGSSIAEFPVNMRGTWMEEKEGIRINSNSLESFKIKKDTLGNAIDTIFQKNTLGDSLKIYQDKKMVFVNYRAESPYWELAIFNIRNNGTIRIYDCRDADLIVKDKKIKLNEALFTKVEKDTIIEIKTHSLNLGMEGEYQHKYTLFSGQLSNRSLRKMTKKEFLVIKLKKDGAIY